MGQNFIKTSDEKVAAELRRNNFTAVSQEGKYYVFLNDGKYNFSEEDNKKIIKTDILCM